MEKRGLSQVVAVVLVIVVALLAAILIWGYMRSTVTESSERVYMQEQCFAISTEMLNCEYAGPLGNDQIWFATGLVKLKQGESSRMEVTFITEDGRAVSQQLEPIEILETKKILPPTKLPERPEYAVASPVVFNQDKTKSLTCTISKRMACNEINFSGDLCEIPTSVEDVTPFVRALTGHSGYYHSFYPDCDIINADFSCDQSVNLNDINPFIHVLENGWVFCNRTIMCDYVWGELGQTPGAWWANGAILTYFNQTCR